MKSVEHLFYVAGDCNVIFSEATQNAKHVIYQIWALQQMVIEARASKSSRAIKNYAEFLLLGVHDAVVRNVPCLSWIICGAAWYLFTVTIVNHLLYKLDIVFLVLGFFIKPFLEVEKTAECCRAVVGK